MQMIYGKSMIKTLSSLYCIIQYPITKNLQAIWKHSLQMQIFQKKRRISFHVLTRSLKVSIQNVV